ncbi:DUF1127 domain-containing protein [Ferrovibrio terrae]|uniref:DUF1127 domain-containing protein n=1 Tax=Ferrovibrio terrae TaxID=2594003 RepID=A0A516H3M9_9PROT|nr:DUF1127 domain-containing protein [Ferrovibrio terrae]QDO98200.1 DUF1127 domain-containing protein [Ferrovibrio terrae]
MQTPRANKTPNTLNSLPYLYLGLTDYVALEREARRARARAIAALLTRGWQALTARPAPQADVGFSREELIELGVPAQDVRAALTGQILGNAIGAVLQRIAFLWNRAVAEAELRSLDDRTLHDMGLSRSDIRAAVAGDIHRPGTKPVAVAAGQPSNDAGMAKVQVLKAKEVVAA